MSRVALLVSHTGRQDIVTFARRVVSRLCAAGFEVRILASEAGDLAVRNVQVVPADPDTAAGVELVLVLGGDGTFLRAAELARPVGAPLLGVNLGRVGFLAETEPDALEETVRGVLTCSYEIEERLTLDVAVTMAGAPQVRMWALNEASIERPSRERMLEVVVEVDDHALTSFGCDGVLCATPTGSTAYAFSAGGPVVWPNVDALLVVPNSAHALFARPLVIGPESSVGVRLSESGLGGVLFCDGRRTAPVPPGGRIEVRRGHLPVRVVRMHPRPFSDRLVAKFQLPVEGFRHRKL